MKFRNWLLEEEAGKPVIMYHGTSISYWPQIKQRGLQAFPDSRSWADDPGSSFNTASRASYGGVYLTANLLTATGAGHRTAKATDSNELLLVVQVDPRTLVADEDQITFTAGKINVPGLVTTEYSASDMYITLQLLRDAKYIKYISQWPESLADQKKFLQKAIDSYVGDTMRGLTDRMKTEITPVLAKKLEQTLRDIGFEAALSRKVAYVDDSTKEYALRNYKDANVQWPEKRQAEEKYKAFIDYLTRLLRKMSDPAVFSGLMHAGRSLKGIGFEGRNKIVYAAEIKREPRETERGTFTRDIPYRLYGEPPAELIKQWTERQGEWLEEKGNNEKV